MKTLSPQAKEMIQRLALRTGTSEEVLLTLYWSAYCDGVIELCRKLDNGRHSPEPYRAATDEDDRGHHAARSQKVA